MNINSIKTKEDFNKLIEEESKVEAANNPIAWGIARCDYNHEGYTLQAVFPVVNHKENNGSYLAWRKAISEAENSYGHFTNDNPEVVVELTAEMVKNFLSMMKPFIQEADREDKHKNVQVALGINQSIQQGQFAAQMIGSQKSYFKFVAIYEDTKPQSVEAVYLKLLLISLKHYKPRELNLDGAFGLLKNCAWVGNKPYDLDMLREYEIGLKVSGTFPKIDYVDKFPRYLSQVIPADNVRILDTQKVRLGAHIADGTTVMPGASYINFNAGTLGACMVEGRISSSVIVGEGTDIGGGASILGVLSGGNSTPITIGKNCLLGANSVTGIPLGDGCIVDAGVTILAGTKITVSEEEYNKIAEVNDFDPTTLTGAFENEIILKGEDLAGYNGIHYRQDSVTGKIIAKRSEVQVELNQDLH